jgi:hypothetical protein
MVQRKREVTIDLCQTLSTLPSRSFSDSPNPTNFARTEEWCARNPSIRLTNDTPLIRRNERYLPRSHRRRRLSITLKTHADLYRRPIRSQKHQATSLLYIFTTYPGVRSARKGPGAVQSGIPVARRESSKGSADKQRDFARFAYTKVTNEL